MIRLLALFMALVLATQASAQIPVCHGGCGSCGGGYVRSGYVRSGCGSCNSGSSCGPGGCRVYSQPLYSQPVYSSPSYSQPVVIGPTLKLYIDDLAGGERYRSYFYARFDNGESIRLPAINGLIPSVTPIIKNGRIVECYLSYGATAKPIAEVKFYDNMVWYTSTVPKQNNTNQTVRAVGGFETKPSTTPVPNRTPLLGPSGLKAPDFDSAPPKGVGLKAPEKVNVNPENEIDRNFQEINDINKFLNKPSSTFDGNLNLGIPRY